MKKLLCLVTCFTVMLSAFSIASYADEAIMLDEANALIDEVKELSTILFGGGIDEYRSSEKASQNVCDGISKEYGGIFAYGHVFCAKEGTESVEYWQNKLKGFFTEEYIAKSNILYYKSGMMAYDGNVYFIDGMVKNVTFPSRGMSKGEVTVTLEDKDTAILSAYYKDSDVTETYKFEFENTQDGWRISGGSAADGYIGAKLDNPQTSDTAPFITVCMLVSILGVSVTLKKRRAR